MLLSSLADQSHSDGRVLGSIKELNHFTITNLTHYPNFQSFLGIISYYSFEGRSTEQPYTLVEDISVLHNIQSIYVFCISARFMSQRLSLVSSFAELLMFDNLELHFNELTKQGAQVLSKFIASSKTLQKNFEIPRVSSKVTIYLFNIDNFVLVHASSSIQHQKFE